MTYTCTTSIYSIPPFVVSTLCLSAHSYRGPHPTAPNSFFWDKLRLQARSKAMPRMNPWRKRQQRKENVTPPSFLFCYGRNDGLKS